VMRKDSIVLPFWPRTLVPLATALMVGAAAVGCKSTDTSQNSPPMSPKAVATVSSFPAAPPTARAVGGPDQATIQSVMTRTVEAASPAEHFTPTGTPLSVPDGYGGTLTAVIGQRTPAADGHGQLVFFWQGNRFIGWDADTEAMSITKVTGKAGYFQVAYAHYAAKDPACCASLRPVTVSYVWQDNDGFVPSGNRPTYGNPVRVKLNS
jgi:hypothetical protein